MLINLKWCLLFSQSWRRMANESILHSIKIHKKTIHSEMLPFLLRLIEAASLDRFDICQGPKWLSFGTNVLLFFSVCRSTSFLHTFKINQPTKCLSDLGQATYHFSSSKHISVSKCRRFIIALQISHRRTKLPKHSALKFCSVSRHLNVVEEFVCHNDPSS